MNGDLKSIPRDVQVGSADRVRVERRVRPPNGSGTSSTRWRWVWYVEVRMSAEVVNEIPQISLPVGGGCQVGDE